MVVYCIRAHALHNAVAKSRQGNSKLLGAESLFSDK